MNPNEKLQKINKILRHQTEELFRDGTVCTVDHSAYDNLEAVLYDMEHGKCSGAYTIIRVMEQLAEVAKILDEPDTYEESPLTSDVTEGYDALKAHDDDWHHPKVEDKEH